MLFRSAANPATANQQIVRLGSQARRLATEIHSRLLGAYSPLEPGTTRVAINDLCRPTQTGPSETEKAFHQGVAIVETLPDLYGRCVVRLAALALEGERLLEASGETNS